ncbi:MAG TPA: TetR/AcrR family transcriptional regulator [Gaiellaceae bacterium]|jgi:AcrR family transcriptional regulator
MTVRTRILEAAADLLARSADADASTRAICEAAGVTAPTLYHHFGDKEGLLAAVVDFGWAQFLETKRTVAAVVHEQVADDIRAGWDNHLQFARENPNFYKLMWSPAVAPESAAVREAYQMLQERLELGAARGELSVSPGTAARTVMAAVTGAALAVISQPAVFDDDAFTTQLREAVIASVTVSRDAAPTTSKRRAGAEPTLATSAATLSSMLAAEDTPLSDPERALMQQWLTTLADTHARVLAGPERRPQRASSTGRSQ